jgi:hypothetical protein
VSAVLSFGPYLATEDEVASEWRHAVEFSPVVDGDGHMRPESGMFPASTRDPELTVASGYSHGPEHQGDDPSHTRNEPTR